MYTNMLKMIIAVETKKRNRFGESNLNIMSEEQFEQIIWERQLAYISSETFIKFGQGPPIGERNATVHMLGRIK